MKGPQVYGSIASIIAKLAHSGIPKARVNADDNYTYRSIDDVCEHLAPLLAQHRLCVLPRVLERRCGERDGDGGVILTSVAIKAAFDIVSARDGSMHTIETYGEALDGADKATAKAMSAAYKQAMLQLFCVPVRGSDETQARTPRVVAPAEQPDPDQGWDQWSADIQDMVRICQSEVAVDRVRQTYGPLLRAASKRRRDIFDAVGRAMCERRAWLRSPAAGALPAPRLHKEAAHA